MFLGIFVQLALAIRPRETLVVNVLAAFEHLIEIFLVNSAIILSPKFQRFIPYRPYQRIILHFLETVYQIARLLQAEIGFHVLAHQIASA